TNRDLSVILGKSEQTIKGWNSKAPELLELVRLGGLCKINNLDIEKIIKLSELQELMKKN
ncbi:MAG: hypothetical protein J7K14_02345, partial [Sulfurimonas sp.]|nr:hypothetical protein [Sulfurimonas sp.]